MFNMDLSLQRKLSKKVLNAGSSRIWFDPEKNEEIKEALTRQDIRTLVNRGSIKVLPKKGVSRARANVLQKKKSKGKKRGPGSRKGKKTARTPKKGVWMARVRALRKFLKNYKEKGLVTKEEYRDLYRKSGGGFFRNIAHLKLYISKFKKKGE